MRILSFVKVYTINDDTLNITVDFYPESWSFLSVGDFIVKKYGKGSIEIKKKTEDEETFLCIFQIKKYLYYQIIFVTSDL